MTSSNQPLSQIELPTVSFARYLDLLKRRTWQVVSVSLLGLVVGGLVALMIPRYYVAHTKPWVPDPGPTSSAAAQDETEAKDHKEDERSVNRED